MKIDQKISSILKNERLMKYFIMAITIVLIELALFQLIYAVTEHDYIAATILSFIIAVILNWIGGRKYIFGVSRHSASREFTMVFIASIGGVIIQLAVVYVSVQVLSLYPLLGKIASIAFSFFWNYFFRSKIIYR